MITGFNTDVEHDGVVYHVQTEDKGLETPLILSLVYTGGAILASKRSRYDDLIASGFDEKQLAERLQRQHKLICAAIRAGRIDDLKKMSGRESAARASRKKEEATEDLSEALPETDEPLELESQPETLPPQIELTSPYEPIPPPPITQVETPPSPVTPPQPPPRRRPNSTRRLVPPLEKPAPPTAEKSLPPPRRLAPRGPRTPAQRRTGEFVQPHIAAQPTELRLGLIDEKNYRGGDRVNLRVHVAQGLEQREAVNNAEVIVKILGSTFRPLILQSKTGPDGIATFIIQLPHFRSGRAAILVRATAEGHEAELRRIIQQG